MFLPLSSSIQPWTVSGGWVSLMCFSASSSSMSPVGESDLNITCRQTQPAGFGTQVEIVLSPGLAGLFSHSHLYPAHSCFERYELSALCYHLTGINRNARRPTFRARRLFLRKPKASSCSRPLRANSINIQPRSPDEMQSFQKDV